MKFSANLGFLFTNRSLPDAVRAAKEMGFDAVECHWPYDTPASEVNVALLETGLPMLGLNTRRGNLDRGENGLAALPGREEEARAIIDEALSYAQEVSALAVHVMAGYGSGEQAKATFIDNLAYAAKQAEASGITILIEPLNRHDAPGYFLQTTDQAVSIIREIGLPNLKLMFDCYHVARTEGDVTTRLTALLSDIGHIQFASVPDRGAPDKGELCYKHVFDHIESVGWKMPLGAEYKPKIAYENDFCWMLDFKGLG